jgi:2-polyprenyl-6-methoxyphenol hydroxylase-like FAD-dependent oxidoreductase
MNPPGAAGQPERFVIIGGGTAGWLAALMLQDGIKRRGLNARVTVVESSKIPTIGVGEATTAVFRQMLQHFNFDEFEFLREVEATFKLGIKHKEWRRKGHSYFGTIDDPHLVVVPADEEPQSFLDIFAVAAGRPVTQTHLFEYLLEQQKSAYGRKPDGSFIPLGPYHHAFHFDQVLAGRYLCRKSKGVEIIDAQIVGARKNSETGDIEALSTDDGQSIEGDFFVDCTGFRRSLIGKEMGGKWLSYAEGWPINRALPFWLDRKDGEEIPPYTLAWARNAGWMWAIPTQKRFGCGYVYSDEFHSPETAQAEIETALGQKIEPRGDIRLDVGRLENAWIGNCMAFGLSSSFLEPLESTSIHGTIVQLMVFTTFHLGAAAKMQAKSRDEYNAFVARQVDEFRDFINMHYVSERNDTPFWQHVAQNCIRPQTKARLALWQTKMPDYHDFVPLPGKFAHVEQQLHYPVLDGLGLLNQKVARDYMAAKPGLTAKSRSIADSLTAEYRAAAPKALGHREFLESL